MARIQISLPSGLRADFEGDADEFEEFKKFLLEDVPKLATGQSSPTVAPRTNEDDGERLELDLSRGGGGNTLELTTGRPIDPTRVAELLEERGANSDIERVAIMAFAAMEAGQQGLDYATAERLYVELGLPRPGNMRSTFNNARNRGLLQNVGRGVFKPTVVGDNYARLGRRPRDRAPRRGRQAQD